MAMTNAELNTPQAHSGAKEAVEDDTRPMKDPRSEMGQKYVEPTSTIHVRWSTQ